MFNVALLLLLAGAEGALAATHYVDQNSTNATSPYTSWTTAATNIQDAVGAAVAGDEIVVTNGTYAGGVNINKPLTMRSVNGPQFTTIAGGGPCVSLASNTSLSGFTVTGGSAGFGGGVSCQSSNATVSNCVITGNHVYADLYNWWAFGGGAYGGTLSNCTLANNSVSYNDYDYDLDGTTIAGGGAAYCTLNNCTLSGNSASISLLYYNHTGTSAAYGGGAAYCTLNNCVLSSNSVAASSAIGDSQVSGGGAAYCTLNHCTVSGGSAQAADQFSSAQCAGAYVSTLDHCTLSGNWGVGASGCALGCALNNCALTNNRDVGANSSTLSNCTLTGNSYGGAESCTLRNCALSGNSGYGALSCLLTNCTLTGNFGGVSNCALANCITYFNSGGNYDSSSTLRYCCTTPMPTNGVGNISSDPELASASHLSIFSPCIGKGSYAAVSGTDIDGEPWANPPSIGCDEYHAGAVTGPLSVAISASFTNVAVGYPAAFTALIEGRTDLSVWDFGDGAFEINQPYTTHSWEMPGDYPVSLWAFNDSYPDGTNAAVIIHVVTGLHYVAANSANPVSPYTTWATAATNIQDAINAAPEAGAQVLVTNGTYAPITRKDPLSVRSLNGAQFTIIDGAYSNRCVSLGNNGSLYGFTLTKGYASGASGGGAYGGTLSNCVLSGNSAYDGGGAASCTLNSCTLMGNRANGPYGGIGGGAYSCTLMNCTLSSNSANSYGGGAAGGTLNNCTLSGNSAAYYGGGANGGTLNNCTLTGNSASYGGGAAGCTLNNCTLSSNSAGGSYRSVGGGANSCTLNNCTLTGNSALGSGGGASFSTLNNCIVYFNSAPQGSNYDYANTLNYSCTTPLPTNGVGNISLDPQLASASHLSAASPCRGAGNAAYASGTDIDGESWASPPSIGCDEYHPGAITGPLSVGITAAFTNVTVGFTVELTALIEGRTTASAWDFGDGITATNQPYTSHAWMATGDYSVVLRAYNESQPAGISTNLTVHVVTGLHYVAANSPNPVAPYTSWATAATNIQDAINATEPGRVVVLVTNGTYAPITASGPVSVRSINGAQFTIIDGGHSTRCAWLGNEASLTGFTLTKGLASYGGGASGGTLNNCILSSNSATGGYYPAGGGAYGCTLSNCTLSGNSTPNSGGGASGCTMTNCTLSGNSASWGGGAYQSTLSNCALTGNSASEGGGAYQSTLNNCTLTGNSADFGGGAFSSRLNNCIVYFNQGANYDSSSALNYCCATPGPGGVGNISEDPQLASASHLSAVSPCRGAGNAAYATGTDIDGEPWASPPSIGCDEYHAGAVTGPLSAGIAASFTNVAAGFTVELTALIEGRTTASVWGFGDGITATNQPYTSHAWTTPGDYSVVLRAYNESQPGGISATVTVHVVAQPVHYVAAAGVNPVAPYTSWATAATNIQDALDALDTAAVPGALVLVTNGTYATGGRGVDGTTNRAAVDKPLVLRSVNGPQFTVIYGGWPLRCVYLASGASLSGFTLTNGFAGYGAGVWCESATATVSNCVLTGNYSAIGYYSGSGGGASGGTLNNCTLTGNCSRYGGGAYGGTLNNCTLSSNSTDWADGGGVYGCTLNDCTLTGNFARGGGGASGGGASGSTLNNCTLSGNSAWYGGGGASGCTLNYCTLSGNSAEAGGGASGGTLNNCVLIGNSASGYTYDGMRYGGNGGGAAGSALNNCTLAGNSASYYGGGAYYGTLDNCTLTGNSADLGGGAAFSGLNSCTLTGNSATNSGGGAYGGTLNNCIAYYNTAPTGANYDGQYTLDYCCTTPLPTYGMGNVTNVPLFVDTNGWANLRLQSNSPCINAGNNSYAVGSTDLDGNPRIKGGTVDIGAYEFQAPSSIISYAWLQQFGLPINSSTDAADPDGDGVNNYHEWLAGTNPTNALSSPAQLTITRSGTNIMLTWPTNALGFTLQSTTNLLSPAAWVTNSPAPVVIGGQNTVTNPITGPQQFYRLIH